MSIDGFDDGQIKLLKLIVDDLGGPTATHSILRTLSDLIHELKPDFELDNSLPTELRKRVDVCISALTYAEIEALTDSD